jgi:hypothetical protein
MDRIEKLCVHAGIALDGEQASALKDLSELAPGDLNRIHHQVPKPYLTNHSSMLKVFGRNGLIISSSKFDRMRRKGRKLIRDPVKFLLDSQYPSLKTVGALLEKI